MGNPFTAGLPVPPERFVGRSRLIAKAFNKIFQPGGNLAIWGGSGIGKTSFLEKLKAPQTWQEKGYDPSAAVIVLMNCLDIAPFTASGFWRNILLRMKNKLSGHPELQETLDRLLAKGKSTKDDLIEILRQLGDRDKFLVLLVDDYDAALHTTEQYTEADRETFLSQCRTVASSEEERKYLTMIVASSRRLNKLGPSLTPDKSPWYNHYEFRQLKPFTDKEVESLLFGLPMTPPLLECIREIADGHPALLQNACSILYDILAEELQGGQIPKSDEFAREFQNATTQLFQQTWEMSEKIEQTLLMLLALSRLEGRLPSKKRYDLGNIDVIFSQKEIELNDLVERGVLKYTVEADERSYSFASSIMEWWVVKHIENSNETELEKRQQVFLNLMNHEQKEKAMAAIRWLWQNKEQVPSVLEGIGKVIAALPKGVIKG